MIRRHPEPLLWMLFSAGGVLSGMLMPVLALLFGVAFPLGWMTPPSHEQLLVVLAVPSSVLAAPGLASSGFTSAGLTPAGLPSVGGTPAGTGSPVVLASAAFGSSDFGCSDFGSSDFGSAGAGSSLISVLGIVIEIGIARSPCFIGMSFASTSKRPSVLNGGVPRWNCGIVIVPDSWQKPSNVDPPTSARLSSVG